MTGKLEFTQNWDGHNLGIDFHATWDAIRKLTGDPAKILEIGVYEGLSSCKMIEMFGARRPISITCVDAWSGPTAHDRRSDSVHEQRFDRNVAIEIGRSAHPVTLRKIKTESFLALSSLIHAGEAETFDWIYIDGSHRSEDVLFDATASFRLLKTGGVLVFDDYLWIDPLRHGGSVNDTPKAAIDAFVNIHYDRLRIFSGAGLWQLYLTKI